LGGCGVKYFNKKKCDGCDKFKMTREIKKLDPKRPLIINNLCKQCDNDSRTITKILNFNNKNLPETHSIFGFSLQNL
jgi:hypothetical protein